jgi:hypothetical protein
MDSPDLRSAVLSAMNTEHFVLQSASSSTIAEAGARSTLYVMALSSALVAMGFLSQSSDVFVPFVATVLPGIFLLGLFTTVRLVDTALENMHYLTGISRVRRFYRSLGPQAAREFASAGGRWPEAKAPSLQLGPLFALLGTTASMIAVINHVVAGTAVGLLAAVAFGVARGWAFALGGLTALVLTAVFVRYQAWRFEAFSSAINDEA